MRGHEIKRRSVMQPYFPGLFFVVDDEASGIVFFMMVSGPEDAAVTIWRSIDLLIFAVKSFFITACFTRIGFLGGIVRLPFLVFAAALAPCRLLFVTFAWSPFVFP